MSYHPSPPPRIHFCVNGGYPTLEEPEDPPPQEEQAAPSHLLPSTGAGGHAKGDGGGPPHDAVQLDPPAGEADHTRDAGAAFSDSPGSAGSNDPPVPHDHASTGPPPRSGEKPEAGQSETIIAWLDEHWDLVKAMALAGEAPQRPAPPPEAEPAAAPPPQPVCVRRGDRWTKPKMAEFLRQLAATQSVSAAARAVGMRRQAAYKLRARLKGQPFDIAWEAAFRHGFDNLAHAALELALEGEEVPHYYQGELKGTHRKRNPQLLLGLLRMRNQMGAPMLGRFGAAAEFWSEKWDRMLHRIETGSVTWDDETRAVGEAELATLDLPDEKRQVDRLIVRNLPDEPKRRFGT
jgi:hypothetical protein